MPPAEGGGMEICMKVINNLEQLKRLLQDEIYLYGAGVRLLSFFSSMQEIGIHVAVSAIYVSKADGNPKEIKGISVKALDQSTTIIPSGSRILLTVSECFVSDIEKNILKICDDVDIYMLNYNIIDSIPANNIKNHIKDFLASFTKNTRRRVNLPVHRKFTVWSCWWQGAEYAPDIVKACIKSWRKNITQKYDIIIVDKNNYQDYIDIPTYIIRKVDNGDICLAHLSDIIRMTLLYKYGGMWLDATVYLTDRLPLNITDYDIYTRNNGGKEFGSQVSWGIWLITANRSGYLLYRFVMEAYFYFYEKYDRALYYLMTDYLIGIACNQFTEIEECMRRIPINNISAMEMMRHLAEPYDADKYKEYTQGSFFQKLTYKIDFKSTKKEGTFYEHICKILN